MRLTQMLSLFVVIQALILTGGSTAAPPSIYNGRLPADKRLGPLKDLNGYFPMRVPADVKAWEKRKEELKRRVLVANGLWPMPAKTPLNAVIHGKVQRDGYTVERVYFESYPGLYVTGLLYRPVNKRGKRPAVLSPHGHGGRLQDHGPQKIKDYIKAGAEKFESGRFPKLARCVQLARMGCVTFIYDMLGYADNMQLDYQLAHRFAKQRPHMDTPKRWGLYSTQAELRLQSVFGIQAYNSIRALDFLCSLPDVDPQRVAVTGGSGGGTQTIILGAIDPRPIAAFPQGMVSTSMQGGCTCENASLLRIGTGNIELAALFAPRPQAMTAANDWTKAMMTKGYPELKQLYTMLGAGDRVACTPLLHFPHNYNYVTRRLMYHWFNRHLQLGYSEPIVERDFKPLSSSELKVWNEQHPVPRGGEKFEADLLKQMDVASTRSLADYRPTDSKSLNRYRELIGGAVETIIGRNVPQTGELKREKLMEQDTGEYLIFADKLRLPAAGEELPVVSLFPKKVAWNKRAVIWIFGQGKSGLWHNGKPTAAATELLDQGYALLSADLLYQGEFLADGKPLRQTRRVANTREYAGYTLGYNHCLFAQRVHDVLSLISFARDASHGTERVILVGSDGAGPIVAAANAIAGDKVDQCATDGTFRFINLRSIRDVNFLPGIVKYGDLPGLLSLSAPKPLLITGVGETPQIVREAYQAAQAGSRVTTDKQATPLSIAKWIIGLK